MNAARHESEAVLRQAIATAVADERREVTTAKLCRDPKNIRRHQLNASVFREAAAEHRAALNTHLLLRPRGPTSCASETWLTYDKILSSHRMPELK